MPYALEIRARSRRAILGLVAIIVALVAAKIAHGRMSFGGDFDIERKFGQRFLTGEFLYKNGLNFPYLPADAMYVSPLAMLPTPVAFAVSFSLAILCLYLTVRLWNRMVSHDAPYAAKHSFMIGLVAIALSSHFIIRDLGDAGPNVFLTIILTAGIYAAFQSRKYLSATWLGLATAIKVTPGIFLPFLIWKREWRLALYTSFAAAIWHDTSTRSADLTHTLSSVR